MVSSIILIIIVLRQRAAYERQEGSQRICGLLLSPESYFDVDIEQSPESLQHVALTVFFVYRR